MGKAVSLPALMRVYPLVDKVLMIICWLWQNHERKGIFENNWL